MLWLLGCGCNLRLLFEITGKIPTQFPVTSPTMLQVSGARKITGVRLLSPSAISCIDMVSRGTVGMTRWYRQ
jgi:hypothetical protein